MYTRRWLPPHDDIPESYFAQFVKLIQSVEKTFSILASRADEILWLIGVYTKQLAVPLSA
jgi:hypothetical protein